MVEQPTLALEAPTVTDESTVRPDHPVARDHDRHRVCSICQADGACGLGVWQHSDLVVLEGCIGVSGVKGLTPEARNPI